MLGQTRAWLAACHIATLKACAIFYGGRIKMAMGSEPAPVALAKQIRCPVVGFFGNEDQNPTPSDVDDYDTALSVAGVPHRFHRYDGAGHGFQSFASPERYREAQSEDARRKVLDFLAVHLASP